MTATTTWTDDRIQLLTRLWRDGLSASQIARVLARGVTRNAVIGKAHRLGLPGRPTPGPTPAGRQALAPREPSRLRFIAGPLRAPCSPGPPCAAASRERGSASVLSVARGQCRWPIGDPLEPGFCLCGAPAARGAYCGRHAAIAYRRLSRGADSDHLLKLADLA